MSDGRASRIDSESEQIWGTTVGPVGGVQQNDAQSVLRAQRASAQSALSGGGWVVVNPCAIRGLVERAERAGYLPETMQGQNPVSSERQGTRQHAGASL